MEDKQKTKTGAIKYARENVGELFSFGGNWCYNSFDESVSAWRQSQPQSYSFALVRRGEDLITRALWALGVDNESINRACSEYGQYGGKWVNYV